MRQFLLLRRFRMVQFSLFAVIGALNTGVDAGLYWVLTRNAGIEPLIASVFSFFAGSVNSFVMNKWLTFGNSSAKVESARQYGRFLIVSLAMIMLHQANLLVFHYGLGFSDLVGKLAGIVMGVAIGFILNKRWVFKLAPGRA